ncbi:MAG: hypothetical protein IGR90_06285 [Synechococcales cyanobacterium K32_A2020_035]|nr:hypothetical protein [Synechococcales cyanobacterium K32_A2020_035]
MNTRPIYTEQPANDPITIDMTPLIEHGDSPTAIILTLAIFVSVLLKSVARLLDH